MSQRDAPIISKTALNTELSSTDHTSVHHTSVHHTSVDQTASKLAVAGGILGALAASSCCALPLALTLLGISGAWMANLRALTAYQPYFIGVAILALGYGFYHVYWKPKVACEIGDACARPMNNTLVKSGLWFGTLITLISLTFSYWFPLILPFLP